MSEMRTLKIASGHVLVVIYKVGLTILVRILIPVFRYF
jgi:hypothetical protein